MKILRSTSNVKNTRTMNKRVKWVVTVEGDTHARDTLREEISNLEITTMGSTAKVVSIKNKEK